MSLDLKFWGIFFGILFAGILGVLGWFSVQAYVGGDGFSLPMSCPDSDADGLTDCQERDVYFTEMYNPDTDGDGYLDGEEVEGGYSPHVGDRTLLSEVDSDRDGVMDSVELQFKSSLYNRDSDGDGYTDDTEIEHGYDPTSPEAKKFKKSMNISLANKKLHLLVNEIEFKSLDLIIGTVDAVPAGNFKISYKHPKAWSQEKEQWLPYWVALKGNTFGLHENVYEITDSLELSHDDAEFLYSWAPIGTKVKIAD